MKDETLSSNYNALSSAYSITVHQRGIVQKERGVWMMVPANDTAQQWVWENEIVIGYAREEFEFKCPAQHNFAGDGDPTEDEPDWSRSTDGGITWTHFNEPILSGGPSYPINFAHPDFGLFLSPQGTYVTYDRWHTTTGPYCCVDQAIPPGREITTRTDYVVDDEDKILLFMSAREPGVNLSDFAFTAKSTDGGRSYQFVSYITLPDEDYRGVMPSTVRINPETLVSCVRRREKPTVIPDPHLLRNCWIDCYQSTDNGASWSFLSKVDDTGLNNGNPPALVCLSNGLLVVAYGVRQLSSADARVSVKVSTDNGGTWNAVGEFRIHEGYYVDQCSTWPYADCMDLGYPRLFVRPDGKLLAVYAWSDGPDENHIHYTLFSVDDHPLPLPVRIGQWMRGLTHKQMPGANRLLLFTLHYIEKGTRFKDPKSVRYGGQTMLKLLERYLEEGNKRTYIAVFYLDESEIQKTVHDDFQIDWEPNRPDNWEASSVFLTNVNQAEPFGDRDTGAANSGNQVACHTFSSVAAGDAVILAGTARKRGSFTLHNEFVKADEFNLSRADVRADGDGVVGHRLVDKTADQQGVIEHSDPGTMVIACIQVHRAVTLLMT